MSEDNKPVTKGELRLELTVLGRRLDGRTDGLERRMDGRFPMKNDLADA